VRIRVVVTAHGGTSDGLTGEHQKQVFVHDDPDLVAGFPKRVASTGTSSPVFANLDGKKGDELVAATDDGRVHAYRPDGTELPGWPVRTATPNYWPFGSPAAKAAGIPAPGGAIGVGAPVVTDLDGDGTKEVVVTDFDGNVWAWEANGVRRAGFASTVIDGRRSSQVHVDPAFSVDTPGVKNEFNRTKPGFAAQPAVGDLDGDGRLDIVAAALDRHVYAWHDDGTPVAGFPVLVVDPNTVQSVDPTTHYVTFKPGTGVQEGGELVATPTLANIAGDARPEIIVGAQESYEETPNIGSHTDVVAPNPDFYAYLPGWPAKPGMLQLAALPTIGDGVSAQAVVGDVNPAPGKEIVASSAVGPLYVLNAQGASVYGKVNGLDVPATWSSGLAGGQGTFGPLRNSNDLAASIVAFGGPALGRLDGDTVADPTAPSAGLTRLLDVVGSDLQLPNDDHVMAWRGDTGDALPGFPQTSPDLAFFATPAVADLDGDGATETIVGNGTYTLAAFDANGRAPGGWPKLTGGWIVGTPGLGDWDGNGTAEVAIVRRDGWLDVWHTAGTASAATGWPRAGGNARNTGEYGG
jgi:hypothetical protein